MIQLDFFEETELSEVKAHIDKVDKSCHNVRKAIFAKHNELQRLILEMKEDVDLLKRNICKGNQE